MIYRAGFKVMTSNEVRYWKIPLSNEEHIVIYDDLRVNNNYLACY